MRMPYAKFPAMLADMSVEPFETFPEEFHIRRETHMARKHLANPVL